MRPRRGQSRSRAGRHSRLRLSNSPDPRGLNSRLAGTSQGTILLLQPRRCEPARLAQRTVSDATGDQSDPSAAVW
jgi:hypothetical protein